MEVARFGEDMKRHLHWFLLNILVVMLSTIPLVNASDDSEVIKRARSLYAQARTHPEEDALIARLAKEAGSIVNEAREIEAGLEQLETLRNLLQALQTLTEQLVVKAERRTNQSEAALERLYRSPAWDNLSFANAAFTYWTAWIDLEIARRTLAGKDRNQILARARKGFQLASLQLFHPGLHYGGWLGIGYVDMLQGQLARSRQLFSRLDDVLSRAPDTPIRQAISLELRLLEARMGDVKTISVSENISDSEAKILRIEAFALLERSRQEDKALAGVAQRLKALMQAGHMDQSLLENMMTYAQEVAAIDVGPWSELAAAEFRLRHKDYRNAMQKFEAFFKESTPQQGINLDGYRYRWALAAYHAGNYHAAARILEKLARRQGLAADIDKAVAKLLYAVQLARGSDALTSRKSMRLAAQQFVNKNPEDPEADSARLIIAQTSSGADDALEALNHIRSKSKHGGDVERTAFHFIARDFSAGSALGRTGLALEDLAEKGIDAYNKLPGEDRRNPLNIAVLLQMRALADTSPNELLTSLDFLDNLKTTDVETRQKLVEAQPDEMIRLLGFIVIEDNPGPTILHALLWSRLHLYDRTNNWSKLTELMLALGEDSDLSFPVEVLYPWIAEREDISQRLKLAQLAHPSASTQPDIDRRFYRLIIESLITMEGHGAAYEKARIFTREYPNSGDAWRLLARTAELANNPFEADRAWRVITDKLSPTTTTWWEAMLNRTRVRATSTRPEQACPLLEELQRRIKYIPDSQKAAYEMILESSPCRRASATIQHQDYGYIRATPWLSSNLRPTEYPSHILDPS